MAFGAGGGTNLNFNLTANAAGFKAGFDQAESIVKGFESLVNNAAGTMKTSLGQVSIPTDFSSAISQSITSFASFDAEMRNVNSMIRLNTSDYETFSNMVLHLNDSLELGIAPAQAAQAAYQAISHGFTSVKDSTELMTASLTFATATLADVGASTKLIAGILDAYNMGADKAMHVTDLLVNTVGKGATTGKELQQTLGRLAPTAAANNVSFEELTAILATLTEKGIRTNQAVTGMLRIINDLAAANPTASRTLKEFGLSADQLKTAVDEQGLTGAMRLLERQTQGSSDKLEKILGKGPALNSFLALVGPRSGSALDEHLEAVKNVNGAGTEAAQAQMEGLGKTVDELKAKIEVAGVTVGATLAPALIELIHVVESVGGAFVNLGQNWSTFEAGSKGLFAVFELFGGSFASLIAYLYIITPLFDAFLTGSLATLVPTFTAGAAAVGTFVLGLDALALTAGALVIVFAAVAAGLVYLTAQTEQNTKDWDEFNKSAVAAERALKKFNDELYRDPKNKHTLKDQQQELEDAQAALKIALDEREKLSKKAEELNSRFWGAPETDKNILEDSQRLNDKKIKDLQDRLKAAKPIIEEETKQEKAAEEQKSTAKLDSNKKFFDALKKYKDDVAAGEFAKHRDNLVALHNIDEEFKGKRSDSAKDSAIKDSFHTLDQEIRQETNRTKKQDAEDGQRMARETYEKTAQLSKSQLDDKKISYTEYVNIMGQMKKDYQDYADIVAGIDSKLNEAEAKNLRDKANEQEKALNRYITAEENKAAATRKSSGATAEAYKTEADALHKLASDSRLQDETHSAKKAELLNKEETARQASRAKEEAANNARIKIEQELQKEKISNATEELGMIKKKAELGLVTESTYTDAVKKTMDMKKQQIQLETEHELSKGKNLTDEEKSEIQLRGEMKIRDLQRQTSKEFVQNMKEISDAKKGITQKTDEEIKKEKEYQDLIHKESQGQTMGLDDFVKQMNTHWDSGEGGPVRSGQGMSAFGGPGDKKAKFLKDLNARKVALSKLGLDPNLADPTIGGGLLGGGSGNMNLSDRAMMNAAARQKRGYSDTQESILSAGDKEIVAAVKSIVPGLAAAFTANKISSKSSFHSPNRGEHSNGTQP